MKTKAIVAVTIVVLTMSLASKAQTYSVNVVGCIKKVYPAGWSMVATPLNTVSNTIGEVLTGALPGTVVYKFTDGAYEPVNIYEPWEEGGWSYPDQKLPPGQGYFVKSPAPWTNTFTGDVVKASTNYLLAGFNMVGSAYSQPGSIDDDLQLVPMPGDRIYSFNNGVGYNVVNCYVTEEGGWATPPHLSFAQGVFYRSVSSNTWVQRFH